MILPLCPYVVTRRDHIQDRALIRALSLFQDMVAIANNLTIDEKQPPRADNLAATVPVAVPDRAKHLRDLN